MLIKNVKPRAMTRKQETLSTRYALPWTTLTSSFEAIKKVSELRSGDRILAAPGDLLPFCVLTADFELETTFVARLGGGFVSRTDGIDRDLDIEDESGLLSTIRPVAGPVLRVKMLI